MVVELVKLLPLREAALLLQEACEPGVGEDETDSRHHQREHRCVTETLDYFWTRPEGKQAASQFGWARSQPPRDLTAATVLGSDPNEVLENVVLWLSGEDLSTTATNFVQSHAVKHLVVATSADVTEIGDDFLHACGALQSVLFVMPGVKWIGNNWMQDCDALVNPQFQGLDSLQTVGGNWLRMCRHLVNPQFQGLDSLQTVGDNWLRMCRHLGNPQFQGLDNLQTVGRNWMLVCADLTNPKFQGLYNLRTVGDSWLQGCNALDNPKFQGLTSLQNVGEFWMANCPSLQVVDLRGLKALETVGHGWMKTQETSALPTFLPLWGKRLQAFQTGEKKFWNGLKLNGPTIKKKR
jgi:hypothetical protein